MADASYGSLAFREQSEFFRRKVDLPTSGWTDVYTREHDWSFVVAGANRDAIVSDFRGAVQKAIDGESTLEDFRKDFDRIVSTHGWDYNGGRDWRSRVIYDTNLSTSYAAGRFEQLQAAPFWEYVHQDWVEHPRALHVSWNGLVLEREDPWWKTHYPPNDWGCHCEVRGLWARDLARLGKSGSDTAPAVVYTDRIIGARSELGPRTVSVPEGIGPGFEYAPGASRMHSAVPPARPAPTTDGPAAPGLPNLEPQAPLPAARPAPAGSVLPAGLAPEAYASSFLERMGASTTQPSIVRDAIGERLVVGPGMFTDASGSWSPAAAAVQQQLPLLAHAIAEPDEIWVRLEWMAEQQLAAVRRRYIVQVELPGDSSPTAVMFEIARDGWSALIERGVGQALEGWRVGARLYHRADDGEAGED